jgi:hypothetical protein
MKQSSPTLGCGSRRATGGFVIEVKIHEYHDFGNFIASRRESTF